MTHHREWLDDNPAITSYVAYTDHGCGGDGQGPADDLWANLRISDGVDAIDLQLGATAYDPEEAEQSLQAIRRLQSALLRAEDAIYKFQEEHILQDQKPTTQEAPLTLSDPFDIPFDESVVDN